MENVITLGQAIAYLYYAKEKGQKPGGLNKTEINYLDSIKARLESLNPDTKLFYRLIRNNKQPDYSDLFISMFLSDNFEKDNLELLRFFNDNIECFEAYSNVLHDFLKKLNDLKIN